ncbi:hypothetical protein EGT07_25755 [Herbaspirillum sp. HC18]|nr:hypothetical protein EGT07_25755 [Herbaspirillum sp. HC18]
MKRNNTRSMLALALAATIMASASAAGPGMTVDGMEISYGVVSAQVIAKPTDKHDPKMHGRKWPNMGSHHLVVSLSDVKSGERISDATVIATVTPLGMAPTEKRLEPMLIDQTTTYGNFFDFPASSAPFRIALNITRPTIPAHNAVAAEFEYRPPGSP